MNGKKLNDKADIYEKNISMLLEWNGIDVHDLIHYVEDGIITIGIEVDEDKADRAMEYVGKLGHADIVSREDGHARIYCII